MESLKKKNRPIASKYKDSLGTRRKVLLGVMMTAVTAVLIGTPSSFQSSLDQVNDVPDIMNEDLDSEIGDNEDLGGDSDIDRDSDDSSAVVSQFGSLEEEPDIQ